MTVQEKEKIIQNHMKNLKCTRKEAEDIINQDYAIDHGERTYFDLSIEEEKQAKKWGNTTKGKKAPTAYKFEKRKTTKENPTKEKLVQMLFNFLNDKVEECAIQNKERQISFDFEGKSFELTLVQKRIKK